MAANPALTHAVDGALTPAPFQGEVIALRRDNIEFWVDGVRTRGGTWSSSGGALFLTNLRLVFVARQADAASGLAAFDLPLGYLFKERFNQPVFGANNLAGQVWAASASGGPDRTQPPHSFKLYFKNGGVGTCIPLFFHFIETMRAAHTPQGAPPGTHAPPSAATIQAHLPTAFVDPSDPSSLFLANPVREEARLPTHASYYAADYERTQHEAYEPTGLQPGPGPAAGPGPGPAAGRAAGSGPGRPLPPPPAV